MDLEYLQDQMRRKSFAATVNLAACLLNVALALWSHSNDNSAWYFNMCVAIFSGILCVSSAIGYLSTKDKYDMEMMSERWKNL